ncbi:hypothetical protein TNCV_4524911 [Trichonephila clavipes]|nr:hypothetical protein TNCV_4524911 [Trichonephila clavipes]
MRRKFGYPVGSASVAEYQGKSCVNTEKKVRDIWNEKVSNHGSIPITIDCNVVAIVFEEGLHQPIKRTKQSVFLDVTVFRHTFVD